MNHGVCNQNVPFLQFHLLLYLTDISLAYRVVVLTWY